MKMTMSETDTVEEIDNVGNCHGQKLTQSKIATVGNWHGRKLTRSEIYTVDEIVDWQFGENLEETETRDWQAQNSRKVDFYERFFFNFLSPDWGKLGSWPISVKNKFLTSIKSLLMAGSPLFRCSPYPGLTVYQSICAWFCFILFNFLKNHYIPQS